MRLIDADAYKKELLWGQDYLDDDTLLTAINILDCAPTIDAVPVVRCKDCKHQRERNEYEQNYLVEGVLICTSPDATDDCWNAVWSNHFCSYGERKENG